MVGTVMGTGVGSTLIGVTLNGTVMVPLCWHFLGSTVTSTEDGAVIGAIYVSLLWGSFSEICGWLCYGGHCSDLCGWLCYGETLVGTG